ncbi:hypothetical protein GH714_034776 [Hevea brasiliensis]|uniref:Uncharacterized protein n=1 Tax=Hevea brasiliensis TaxID=3981 RepID=A0A6A6KK59_HEVBR|nr:hypothetical protein GH714_034776 [Hevea brasiliensis]
MVSKPDQALLSPLESSLVLHHSNSSQVDQLDMGPISNSRPIEDTQTAQTVDLLEVQPVPDQSNTIDVPSTGQSTIETSAPVDTNASCPQRHRTMPYKL